MKKTADILILKCFCTIDGAFEKPPENQPTGSGGHTAPEQVERNLSLTPCRIINGVVVTPIHPHFNEYLHFKWIWNQSPPSHSSFSFSY
jgi:hypothetical protein